MLFLYEFIRVCLPKLGVHLYVHKCINTPSLKKIYVIIFVPSNTWQSTTAHQNVKKG